MKNKIKPYWAYIVIIFILIIIGVFVFQRIQKKQSFSEHTIEGLTKNVEYYRNKYNQEVARVSLIETEYLTQFTKLNLEHKKELTQLQELADNYKGQLKEPGGSATIVHTKTQWDTVYLDTTNYNKVVGKDTILNTIENEWIKTTFGRVKDSTVFRLETYDVYGIVLGRDKNKRPFADIITHSPYSSVKEIRSYRVKMPPEKKNHIGIQVTYGIGSDLKPQPIIGIGYTRSIFSF